MNSEQAKKISLPRLMEKMGYTPVKTVKGGNELWYASPFRNEKDPSFHTSFLGGKWIWNDFGDRGGTVIDFVMRHENFTRVSDALAYLRQNYDAGRKIYKQSKRVGETKKEAGTSLFSFQQQYRAAVEISEADESQLRFITAGPVRHPAIFQYLEEVRLIPRPLIDRYLVEVSYENIKADKTFFAFGMQNRTGGYEIRAATDSYSFKSALNGRDVTLVPGSSPERGMINLFEGMTDFLSLLVMYNTMQLSGDSLILHSLSSFQRAVATVKEGEYRIINTFLDNDQAGKKETQRYAQEFGSKVKVQSSLFEPHSDLNAALQANQTQL